MNRCVIDIFAKFFSAAVSMCERDSQKKGWVLVWGSVAKEEIVRRGEFEGDALNVYSGTLTAGTPIEN